MADDLVKKGSEALVVLGLVAAPAVGGQVVSAGIKVMSDTLRDAAADNSLVEFGLDVAGGAVVAAAECGVAALFGKAGAWKETLPFAAAGALACGVLPQLDKVVDGIVRRMVGAATGADMTTASEDAPAPGGAADQPAALRAIPGGKRGPQARDAFYTRSRTLPRPGGYTVGANQNAGVATSRRLRMY